MRFALLLAVLAAAVGCRPSSASELSPIGAAELQSTPTVTPVAPVPARTCATDGWTTYAHDSARTSSSHGCVDGPLRVAWKFAPRSGIGAPTHVTRAVGDGDAVYAAGAIGPTPALWRVDPRAGVASWTYDTHGDSVRDGWPTLAPSKVLLVDDGVFSVDTATGRGHRGELDAWGESLTDGEHLFAENDWYLDGYGLYVSAFDLDARLLWRRDYNALSRGTMVPDVGGLALDDGVLVHAAQHGPLTGSGLSAFDPQTGERTWRVDVSPQSSPSIAAGQVFTVERHKGDRGDRLAARSLSEGALLWSNELPNARGPAPVQAGALVIVHARDGVVALDRASGERAWSAPLPRIAPPIQSATTLAVALGSGTVVVVSGKRVHLLRLQDGNELWSGEPVSRAKHLESPVVVGNSVYVVADGALVRLESAAN